MVFLELKKEEDMNVIEIRNKHSYLVNDTINKIMKVGYSTKLKEICGYGLPNIKKSKQIWWENRGFKPIH